MAPESLGTMASDNISSCARNLELRNDLAELDRLGAVAREFARDSGISDDQRFAVELCLEEAVVNIMTHGAAGNGAARHISVTLVQNVSGLVAHLEDDGAAFDPTTAAPPATPASLEEAPIGGLGLTLIRKLTSAMHYERVAGRNCLTLTFARSLDSTHA